MKEFLVRWLLNKPKQTNEEITNENFIKLQNRIVALEDKLKYVKAPKKED